MSHSEYEEDLHAELGYRTAGRREVSQREWYSLRGDPGEAAPTPKAFETLVNRLRSRKWQKENPGRRAVIAKAYYLSGGKETMLAGARKRRLQKFRSAAPVIVCAECGAAFCEIRPRRGSVPRKFCTINCLERQRQRIARRAAGARQTSCGRCGEPGHNSRRCTSGATSARGAGST